MFKVSKITLAFTALVSAGLYLCAISSSNAFFWKSSPPEAEEFKPLRIVETLYSGESLVAVTSLESLAKHKFEEESIKVAKEALASHLSGRYKVSKPSVEVYVDLAWDHAEDSLGVTPELLLAIMQKESSLNEGISNSYGAMGLMQVVPRWHPEKIKPDESWLDPKVNVRIGAQVLTEYLGVSKGDLPKALKRYSGNARNYSITVINEAKKLTQLGEKAKGSSAPYINSCSIKNLDAAQFG